MADRYRIYMSKFSEACHTLQIRMYSGQCTVLYTTPFLDVEREIAPAMATICHLPLPGPACISVDSGLRIRAIPHLAGG